MEILKKHKEIALLLFVAFLIRFFLLPYGFHPDIIVNANWGEFIHRNGTVGFYESPIWETLTAPTQPPLVSLVYGWAYDVFEWGFVWILSYTTGVITNHNFYPELFSPLFSFYDWFVALYAETPQKIGALITLKLIPVISDLLLGLAIYVLARKRMVAKKALLFPTLYLISPFSFYISALWGQYDQVTFLFALFSFISIFHKRFVYASPLLLAISVALKPTSLIFVPIYLWLYFLQKPKFKTVILGGGIAAVVMSYTVYLFSEGSLFEFINNVLIPNMFDKADHRIVNNAFNFWKIFFGEKLASGNQVLLFLPAKVWGYVSFAIFNIAAFCIARKNTKKLENTFYAMFIVSAGSFMFMTNMLERYFFAGIVCMLIASVFNTKLVKYWILASFIFWINLYKEWWFPGFFDPLKQLLVAGDFLLVRVLALANTVIFAWATWLTLRPLTRNN